MPTALSGHHLQFHCDNGLAADLEDAIQQISLPTREAAPVGQDDQRQALLVHLLNRVRRFQGAVWVPDLASLHMHCFYENNYQERPLDQWTCLYASWMLLPAAWMVTRL